tara:strand:- start:57 stop:386 length:330 start_codon:yes stop_codon:yes gene_type:complete
MKRLLFNWLFKSQKANLNGICYNFKSGDFMKSLNIDDEDGEIFKKMLESRFDDIITDDKYNDKSIALADLESEMIFRGAKLSGGMYALLGFTVCDLGHKRTLKKIMTGA